MHLGYHYNHEVIAYLPFLLKSKTSVSMYDSKEKNVATLKSNFLSFAGQVSNITILGDLRKSDADFRVVSKIGLICNYT